MRDNTKVQEVLTDWQPFNWRYAVVYDEPNVSETWDYQLATDIDELNEIMNETDPDLHPEIWTREVKVTVHPPATRRPDPDPGYTS